MEKLYRKNEFAFSLLWIALYVVLFSVADAISESIGIIKIVTLPVTLALVLVIIAFIRNNRLWEYYGLCRLKGIKYGRYIYFIPLAAIASSNLWNGVTIRYSAFETILFIVSMFCVGFIEELIFRGFLFRSIEKKNIKTAMIVSSVTFGLGHIVNLLNGAEILPTVLQIIYATSIGYLFTVFFVKSHSLIPCIVVHGTINALSVFAVEGGTANQIISAAVLIAVSLGYAIYLNINAHMVKEREAGQYNMRSLYLCVLDMKRAVTFYEKFLEQPVTVEDDIYSVFDINGFRLGLFAFEKMKEPHTFGTNCLPSIEVENLEILQQKLKGLKTVFPVTQIGLNWVSEFEDSEGNHIEMTAPVVDR